MFNITIEKLFEKNNNVENKTLSTDLPLKRNSVPWETLPNEIWARIVGFMDLETCLEFRTCGVRELELTRKFSKHDVFLMIEYVKKGVMNIRMLDINSEREALLTYRITGGFLKKNKLKLMNANGDVIEKKKLCSFDYAEYAFRLVGVIFMNPMFSVKKLEFRLNHFNRPINFGHKLNGVDELIFTDCVGQNVLKNVSDSFSEPPRMININQVMFPLPRDLFLNALGFPHFDGAIERFTCMKYLFHNTQFPFRGNTRFRDAEGHLTPRGFNVFLKIILSRYLPVSDPCSRGFMLNKCFANHLEEVGQGLHWHLRDDCVYYHVPSFHHCVCVSYEENCTRGEILICKQN